MVKLVIIDVIYHVLYFRHP